MSKLKYFFFIVFYSSAIYAEPYIVQVSTTSFGSEIAISTGSCNLTFDTSTLTNTSGVICTGTMGSRGHYKVYATPSTTVRIVVRPHNDSGDGVVFSPDGVVFSDSTAEIAFVEYTTINIDSGVSGIVEIYVGGVLSLLSKQFPNMTVNFTYEIDFSEI
ncbi:hypothetical protein [Colwellia sp. TT2012]|uniref:hypothetical protein n=1 Tax=Colwellia sp. TT2012 TaxID=1720342 RepID=UPI000709F6E0|nr:hypothetical protein [Colwellia sp. TT2012]